MYKSYITCSARDDTALRHGLVSTGASCWLPAAGGEWFPRPATRSRQVRGPVPAPDLLCPPASTRCADGCMAAAGTRAHQPSDPVFNHTALAATCLAPATRARTKMTDCLEARIRRSTRTGGQAARTGVEAPVRAATGKDVNAHLTGVVSGVCGQVWWRPAAAGWGSV